ncbi:NinB [Tenacibaculum phage Gundel_1]|uniref:NinB n=1 Tax=Tenacibaculum phage Gundel_1 TaxID=2745672 RepID=A0A8E5EC35_9CAUD|nr:NinB [Tenacibaculum phage Gundel_1]QQV91467.1 NinB [Tenacibaculum phage Gundel_1]
MKIASSITLPVQIKNGKFNSNLNTIIDIIKAYEGHTIDITFKKRSNKRSNKQNKYYWSVIIPIFNNCIKVEWDEIWSLEETHNFLKSNCNYEELVNEDTGEIIRRTKSTTENSTTDQELYHKQCRRLADEFFNTEIPLPNKKLTLKF